MPQPSESPAPSVDLATVARVAHLARLGLSPAQFEAARGQLSSLLGHFQALQAVDTTGVEPLVQAVDTPGQSMADEPAPFPDPRLSLLPLTPHAREGFYVVPRVHD
ncbi:MAG: Asp-tRNA(Asn)/Glu-tRNA(Gln) amidotransferase subunit GatC [Planctomycetota bacterium]